MNRFVSTFLVVSLGLAGCVSVEEQTSKDRATCARYGFAEGSEAFAECMMRTAIRRNDDNRAQLDRYQAQSAEREWQKIARERNKSAP